MSKKYKTNIELQVLEDSPLLEFLYVSIKGKSKNNIKSLLGRGNILINNKIVKSFDYPLKKGQIVMIKMAQISDGYDNSLDIIYEDDDLVVINKSAGLLSVSTTNEKINTAYKMVMEYVKKQNPRLKLFVVHRLDRETSGILMFAKKENVKIQLQENWNELIKKRSYIGIVEGNVLKEKDTIRSWLKESKTMVVYSSHKKDDGKEAITHYEKLKNNSEYSLLRLELETGRKNQIRVHMKDIGHSIVGDKKYSSTTNPLKRLGLHAHILELEHPITKKTMVFEAEIPALFLKMFK
ncbi:MAG: RluA family pseudouridine synthase [Bacilli bacterium]